MGLLIESFHIKESYQAHNIKFDITEYEEAKY